MNNPLHPPATAYSPTSTSYLAACLLSTTPAKERPSKQCTAASERAATWKEAIDGEDEAAISEIVLEESVRGYDF
ncbi:hypothetical protein E4U21_000031 [Claviceps maximensis]|nr:hypothetical protein E4U21_000031 [Claviceps maximensis]